MKLMFDCAMAMHGGSIQAALAVLSNAAQDSREWHTVVSGSVAQECPREVLDGLASTSTVTSAGPVWRRLREGNRLLRVTVDAVRPAVAFTLFGPTYWHAPCPHLVGFARPYLLYPDVALSLLPPWPRARQAVTNALHARSVRRTPWLVAETRTVRTRLADVMGYDPARVFVVRNTYSPAFAHALASSTKAPPEDVLRVAVPSAYYIHKNLEFVPEVAAALKDRGLENVRFALTLPEQDQPWQRIRARAEQLQVANMVKTEGRVPHGQIADLYRSAHAVFLPTLLECSTATYPEAFAAGAPLVTSDRDFARELCGDGALFVDPFNAEQAAEALARALTDQDVREELVSHGRAALEENYISPEEKWRQQLLCMETLARGEPIPQELT